MLVGFTHCTVPPTLTVADRGLNPGAVVPVTVTVTLVTLEFGSTLTVSPTMVPWMPHLYGNVPAVLKVKLADPPVAGKDRFSTVPPGGLGFGL